MKKWEKEENMQQNDLISIIIPVYKVEEYIDECVNSLINQTYKNIEIILVDDGSPDSCGDICEKYKEMDSRIVVLHKKNGGLSDARNAGMQIANGNYFVFVDSDDYVSNKYVEILYNALNKDNADIAVAEMIKFYDNDNPEEFIESEEPDVILYSSRDIMNLYFTDKAATMTSAWGKIYKRNLFNEIQYPKGKLHEDEFTTYKLMHKAEKIAYVNIPLYFYRQRNNSIINSKYNVRRLDVLDAYKERLDFFKEFYSEIYSIASAHYLNRLLICYNDVREINKEESEKVKIRFKAFYKTSKLECKLSSKDKFKWHLFNTSASLYSLINKIVK